MFRFKKFSVEDNRCAMKVGTDAVLLGAWTTIGNAKRILDVGTGCGIIALMLAQRTDNHAHIDAIEIEKQNAEQAQENVLQSPWSQKIQVYNRSLQQFVSASPYDLIVTNPPYFINSLLSPTQARSQARHTSSLTFGELVQHAIRLLSPHGRMALILPPTEGNVFKKLAEQCEFYLIRETAVFTRFNKPQERCLLEFSTSYQTKISDEIILFDQPRIKHPVYQNLTGDFYL